MIDLDELEFTLGAGQFPEPYCLLYNERGIDQIGGSQLQCALQGKTANYQFTDETIEA